VTAKPGQDPVNPHWFGFLDPDRIEVKSWIQDPDYQCGSGTLSLLIHVCVCLSTVCQFNFSSLFHKLMYTVSVRSRWNLFFDWPLIVSSSTVLLKSDPDSVCC
jgi:hypothetical protein